MGSDGRAAGTAVILRPADDRADVDRFVAFPRVLYAADPHWVGLPDAELARRLDPDRNPFYRRARRQLFVALRDGAVVGTAAAIMDDASNAATGANVGYFGFFESIDDPSVSGALLGGCAAWLAERGAGVMRGPVNGTASDERGVLVAGFGTRPALWEGHSPPYYQRLLEAFGLEPCEDVLAYEITYDDLGRDLANVTPALTRAAERAVRRTGVKIRAASFSTWDSDLRLAHDLYERSHATIPGHAGMRFEVFRSIAESLRPILDPDLALFAQVDSEQVGLAWALPDVNEALPRGRARLTVRDRLRLWWGLRRITGASLKLIGVTPEARHRGVEAALMLEMGRRLVAKGYERCEISLVSERNAPMTRVLDRIGARVYRRYRVFETRLPPPAVQPPRIARRL